MLYSLMRPLPWLNAKNEKEMLRLKEEFLDKQLWQGKLADAFDKLFSYIFSLS